MAHVRTDHFREKTNVADSKPQCVDFRESFLVRQSRYVMSKPLERFVNALHAFSLAQVCSMSLRDLLRWGFPPSLSFQVLVMMLRRGEMKLAGDL